MEGMTQVIQQLLGRDTGTAVQPGCGIAAADGGTP
jgi:hypothetical protein